MDLDKLEGIFMKVSVLLFWFFCIGIVLTHPWDGEFDPTNWKSMWAHISGGLMVFCLLCGVSCAALKN